MPFRNISALTPHTSVIMLLVRKLPKLPFTHHKWFVKLPELCTHKKVNLAPAPAMPCVVPAAASQAREEEHREKEQSLKHISALAGADAFALAVETDEVAEQMAECLMDLETSGPRCFRYLRRVLNITVGYMQW